MTNNRSHPCQPGCQCGKHAVSQCAEGCQCGKHSLKGVPRDDFRKFDREEALRLEAQGVPDTDIARHFGVTRLAIVNARYREGRSRLTKQVYTRTCWACGSDFPTTNYQQTHCGKCGLRKCQACKKVKPVSRFSTDKSQIDGHTKRCKSCAAIVAPVTRRRATLKRWGLTEETLIQMWEDQNRACAICLKPVDLDNCHMDHAHSCCKRGCSKCLRGITHGLCNSAIGYFNENPEALRNAADYCDRWDSLGRGIPQGNPTQTQLADDLKMLTARRSLARLSMRTNPKNPTCRKSAYLSSRRITDA